MEQYSAEWQAWHDARISDLATPFGWLSVTGLTWLTSLQPVTWPEAPGTFTVDGDWVHFTLADGVSAGPSKAALEVMSRPVGQRCGGDAAHDSIPARASHPAAEVRVDSSESMSARLDDGESLNWFVVDHVTYELIRRDGSYGIRRRDSKAPLLQRFIDIPTFPLSQEWIVSGAFTPYPEPEQRRIATACPGLELDEQLTGEVRFTLCDVEYVLKTSGSPEHGLHINFHDYTNGRTTATWRRINLGLPDAQGHVIIDFNRTINYPFAFIPHATCPAPVPENVLPVELQAGERLPTQTLSESGINTPVLFIDLSPEIEIGGVIDLWTELGLDVTLVNRDEPLPPLPGFAALVVFCWGCTSEVRTELITEIVEMVSDAMATRIPVVAVGTATTMLAAASLDGSLTAGRITFEKTADSLGPIPLAVTDTVAEDRLFRNNISRLDPDGVGYIVIDRAEGEELPAGLNGDADRVEARREAQRTFGAHEVAWRDLAERFARLLHTTM